MANIFTNKTYKTETWSAQGAVLEYYKSYSPDIQKLPLLITNFELSFSRSLSQVYPINSDLNGNMQKINVCGAPQGILRVGSIFSPTAPGLVSFLEALSAECKTEENEYEMSITPLGNQCTNNGTNQTLKSIEFILTGVELESLAVTIQGGQAAMVNQPLSFSFTSLEVKQL